MNQQSTTIGLIGDVHAEDVRLEATLRHLADSDVSTILCTGDLADGRGNLDRVVELLIEHEVKVVAGNHDRWLLADKYRHVPKAHSRDNLKSHTLDYFRSLPKSRSISFQGHDLLLCHGVGDQDLAKVWPGTLRMAAERSETLDSLIDSHAYQWIINGHVHFQTVIPFRTLTLINAGTLAGERWPGFLTLDPISSEVEVFSFRKDQIQSMGTKSINTLLRPWKNTQCFSGDWDPSFLVDPQSKAA